jgi:hypothetical protein
MFRFESSLYRYEQLCEQEYLESVFRHVREEMGSRMEDYDFFLYAAQGNRKPPASFTAQGAKPKVLLYISDETCSVPFALAKHFTAIFKCHLPCEYPEQRIFSLPAGYVQGVPQLPMVPTQDREYNVFFSGYRHLSRGKFYRALSRLASRNPRVLGQVDPPNSPIHSREIIRNLSAAFSHSCIQFTSGFTRGLDHTAYGRMLQNSRIALCPRGWKSRETFRHFEAMRAGCVLISDPLPDTRLYRGAPILYLEDWNKLEDVVDGLLQDFEHMRELQRQTVEWWESVCSERATAAFIREHLQQSRVSAPGLSV